MSYLPTPTPLNNEESEFNHRFREAAQELQQLYDRIWMDLAHESSLEEETKEAHDKWEARKDRLRRQEELKREAESPWSEMTLRKPTDQQCEEAKADYVHAKADLEAFQKAHEREFGRYCQLEKLIQQMHDEKAANPNCYDRNIPRDCDGHHDQI